MPDICTDNGRNSPENIRKLPEPDRTNVIDKDEIADASPNNMCCERSRTPEQKNRHKKKQQYRSRSRSFSPTQRFSRKRKYI